MFAGGRDQACSSLGAIAWLSRRSGYVVDGLRSKGDRNHWTHLRVQGQRILYQRVVALIAIGVRQRKSDLLLVQCFEALKSSGGLISPAHALQHFRQAELGRCMNGVQPQSRLKFGQSLLRLMQFEQDGTQKVVSVRVVRIKGRRFLKAFQGLRILRFDAVQNSQRVPDMRVLGILGRGLFERLLGFRHFLQVDQRDAAVHLGLDQRRVKLVGVSEFCLRLIQQLLVHQGGAKVVQLCCFRLLGRG